MRDLGSKVKKLALAGLASAALVGGTVAVSTAPAEAGARTGTWRYGAPAHAWRGHRGYHPGYYRGRRHYGGGAVAAGVVGGLALGALAASAPAYGYPAYSEYVAPGYGGDCYWVTRQRVNAWGEMVVRRVQVCD